MNERTELEESQKSADVTHKQDSGNITKVGNVERLEDTLFTIANSPDFGWFLAIGHKRITDCYPTREEAIAQIELDKWNIIMKMIIIVTESTIAVELEERSKLG